MALNLHSMALSESIAAGEQVVDTDFGNKIAAAANHFNNHCFDKFNDIKEVRMIHLEIFNHFSYQLGSSVSNYAK